MIRIYLAAITFVFWATFSFWNNVLIGLDIDVPVLSALISPSNLWRGELHGGFLFSLIHALASFGYKRGSIFVFWAMFWAYVFEHLGISCYDWLGCPFGEYGFSENFLSGWEGLRIGVVPIGVWTSWLAWNYLTFRLANLMTYLSFEETSRPGLWIRADTKSLLFAAFLDGLLSFLRSALCDAIYATIVFPPLTETFLKFSSALSSHYLFLGIPLRNSLMWFPIGVIRSLCIRFSFKAFDRSSPNAKNSDEDDKLKKAALEQAKNEKYILDLIYVTLIACFPMLYLLSTVLPLYFKVATFFLWLLPSFEGVRLWYLFSKGVVHTVLVDR